MNLLILLKEPKLKNLSEKKLIFETSADLDGLKTVAERVFAELKVKKAFCLWLDAEMGMGKTTLTNHLLREFGLSERIPVTSPTYTYLNEYFVNNIWIAHLDLYRMSGSENLYDLGLFETRPFSGYIVEWPRAVIDPDPLQPSHILTIRWKQCSREYRLFET